MKLKTIFRTLKIEGYETLFDFPQNIPLPRIGEEIIFNGKQGFVNNIKHIITDDVAEIKIIATKNNL